MACCLIVLTATLIDLRGDLDACTEQLLAACDEITAMGGKPFHRAARFRAISRAAHEAHAAQKERDAEMLYTVHGGPA